MSDAILDYTLTREDLDALEGMPELRSQLDGALERAREAGEVRSEVDAELATEALGVLAAARKAAEAKRLEIVAPFTASSKVANGAFRELVDPVTAAEQALKDQVGAYHLAERKKAEAEAARLQAEADERQRQAEADAAEAAAPAPEPPPPVEPVAPAQTRRSSTGAAATTRLVWKYEVTDPALVPREYLTVNEPALGAAVRAGQREIPGVRIFEAPSVAVRS